MLRAQTGAVAGRITDAGTGFPVRNVQIGITGTSLNALTDAEGRYRVANVPATAREVSAKRIGYKPGTATFAMTAGATVTVDLALTESATTLEATVVTGTIGDTRKRAIGNSVATVNASDVVAQSAVSNITEVLQAKTPGLTLMPGSGTVGTGSELPPARRRFVVRRQSADHLRRRRAGHTTHAKGQFDLFGQTTTGLDAFNPADIETIEVIKGPAASTLYGAEAAAGVIQIITKKGRAGNVKWESRYETGQSDWDENLRPVNYAIATAARLADTVTWPGFKGKQLNDIISFRPMSDGRALRTAGLTKYTLSASGGTDRYNFFVSAAADQEDGVYFNNFQTLNTLRGNFSFVPTNKLTFATNIGLSHNHYRLPLNDNVAAGLIISSYLAVPGRTYAFPAGPEYSTITPEIANTYDNQTLRRPFLHRLDR